MSTRVKYEFEDSISTITLDDGKVNVMSVAMLTELNQALDQAQADEGIVILTGRQGMFSAGFDLKVFQSSREETVEMLTAGARLTHRLRGFPQPIVAGCGGHAMAMGFFALLSADYVIAAEGEFKITANEVAIGLTLPGFAIEACRHRLPPAHIHRAAVTAEIYSPTQAINAGIVDEVVPDAELLERCLHKAQALKSLNLPAYRGTKQRCHGQSLEHLETVIANDVKIWTEGQSVT